MAIEAAAGPGSSSASGVPSSTSSTSPSTANWPAEGPHITDVHSGNASSSIRGEPQLFFLFFFFFLLPQSHGFPRIDAEPAPAPASKKKKTLLIQFHFFFTQK